MLDELKELRDKWERKKNVGIKWLRIVGMSPEEASICEVETARAAEIVDDLTALISKLEAENG